MEDNLPSHFSVPPILAANPITPRLPLHEVRVRDATASASKTLSSPSLGDHELDHLPRNSRDAPRRTNAGFTRDDNADSEHDDPDNAIISSDSEHDHLMSRRASKQSHSPNPARRRHGKENGSTSSAASTVSGAADMNGGFLERRKPPTALDIPQDSASQAARLIGHGAFTLDDDPPMPAPQTPKEAASKGFFELPEQDRRNFLLLVLLYFLQGIPMGLAGGSVPFLLKNYLSYGQIGVYSLASYPYSLKLLWSPIVDAVWSTKLGRRKSWILPIQMLSGFGMIWLGAGAQKMMEEAGKDNGAGVWGFTGWWFSLVFMCATQDIAVDGWALTLLSPANLSYASTAQTVGLTAGQFLSYTVFLALSSPDFANKYFRAVPKEVGLFTLDSYLTFWGWAYIVVTIGLAVMKREERTKERDSITAVYKVMYGILKLRNIQIFILIHLVAKLGFQANDAVTNLKLLEKGFSQEDLALTILIDFPFEISLGYYAGKWSEQYKPITVWSYAFVGRLIAAVFAQLVVMIFPAGGTTTWYLLVVIVEHVFSTFMSTVMFVAISAFHAKIADPLIGGTYMTLLATVSNLGGTFPRFFILKMVDYFTAANCVPPSDKPVSPLKGELITQSFSCVAEAEKRRCIDGGGVCSVRSDGYYIVNAMCVTIGVIVFWGFIKPQAQKLQRLPLRAWRIAEG